MITNIFAAAIAGKLIVQHLMRIKIKSNLRFIRQYRRIMKTRSYRLWQFLWSFSDKNKTDFKSRLRALIQQVLITYYYRNSRTLVWLMYQTLNILKSICKFFLVIALRRPRKSSRHQNCRTCHMDKCLMIKNYGLVETLRKNLLKTATNIYTVQQKHRNLKIYKLTLQDRLESY